ncbi:hypothetical protein AD998_05585 [bacterium 336/3]|nr:hypothetical protein AD998_05585 [bacterium 336/3]
MLKLYFLISVFFITTTSIAQVDSLLVLARNNKDKKQYVTAFKYYYQVNTLLKKEKDLKNLISSYIETASLCNEWQVYNQAAHYFQKAQEVLNELSPKDLSEKTIFLTLKTAKAHENDKSYPESIRMYEKYLNLTTGQSSNSEKQEALSNLANLYNLQNQYKEGLSKNLEALTIYEQIGNTTSQATTLNNIGFGYKKLQDNSKAIEYFEKSIALQNQQGLKNKSDYRTVLINVAILYQAEKNFSQAKKYLLEAEKSLNADVSAKEFEKADIFDLMSKTYFYSGEIEKAEKYCNQAIQNSIKSGNLEAKKSAHETLSLVYATRNQNNTALEEYTHYKKTSDSIFKIRLAYQDEILRRKQLSEEVENELKLLQAEQEMKTLDLKNFTLNAEKKEQAFKIEQQQKNLALAESEQQRLAEQARLSSLLIERQRQESVLQQQALDLAQQTNRLREAELQNAKIQQEAYNTEQHRKEEILLRDKKLKEIELQNEIETRKNQQILFLLIGGGVLSFLGLAIFGYIQKRKDNNRLKKQKKIIEETNVLLKEQRLEILEKNDELNSTNEELSSAIETISLQKNELEDKNRSILDSINYAKRIQQSLVPSEETFQKYIPESFVLYLPKDIVSGDFYWLYEGENFVIVAVMDCTGHGVPGAFMSMIGANMLDKIVKEDKILVPNKILERLDLYVKKAIENENHQLIDGMDGVIVLWDKINKELQYAGAVNSIYMIKNQGFEEIRGDVYHIAGVSFEEDVMKQFTLHTIPITEPTTIYMASDGFQDQMGGEKRKKFMTKKFKQLLLDNHLLKMSQQKQLLLETLHEWKGNIVQTDDILVIGMQL